MPKAEPGIRHHVTLTAALKEAREPVVLLTGRAALDADQAVEILEAGLDVILDRPDAINPAGLTRVADLLRRRDCLIVPVREDSTGSVAAALQNLLGKVAPVSHVSFIDRRPGSDLAGRDAEADYAQLTHFGLDNLESMRSLFNADPLRVMARCTRAPWSNTAPYTTTEVFLELAGNVHVQYFGSATSSRREQSLWIEGARGSLRCDGAVVWWRKRGWPRFAPWRWRPRAAVDAGRSFATAAHRSLTVSQELRAAGAAGAAARRAAFAPLALLEAVMRSNEEARVVEMDSLTLSGSSRAAAATVPA
jgi:predicted dehydrogenase